MVGIVLISENSEGRELLKTARRLLGTTQGMTSVCLRPGSPIPKMRMALERAIRRVHAPEGTLLLTDFFGSTQCNLCLRFLKPGAVELLTGFNLPMIVKLGMVHEKTPLNELVPFILRYGREQMHHFTKSQRSPVEWKKRR